MHSQQLNDHHSSALPNTNTQTEKKIEPPTPPPILLSFTSKARLHQLTLLTIEEYQSRRSQHRHIIVK